MLEILEKTPDLNREIILEIEPLAPLSMVSDLPGSYYKTLKSPSKKMLCGLFENILEWHIDAADRKEIVKEIKKIRKKQKVEFHEEGVGSNFLPLLMEYFEVKLEMFPKPIHFDDYWSKAYRRADAIVHPKGTFNISYELIPQKRDLPRNDKKPTQVDDKALERFFLINKEVYPLYYSSPTGREYIFLNGKYKLKIEIDMLLFQMLKEKLESVNIAYLGNSEGWVDVKMLEL
ncbi:type I-PGING CRISPR-associated protein Cas5p [Algoriphagus sp. AGSA1]|uniref:type I-PGING CRISPR-associated protein Cas5p n=1 Tax=Algoriphagus sp. AGSA1 TaxID=2907213 RepID=UPI001F3047DD|nr:type I-PGING CRISPR-associated protein Cas5p [Algoriphagus sp. AGSA1]MCE7057705.1 type I-PGING CRISPR-associated protein Cas5p [Algoriphagus sp. AGSA1]